MPIALEVVAVLLTEAFAKYGAKLKNRFWSVSAFNSQKELVISLWSHHFRKLSKEGITYVDRVSRWQGNGQREMIENLNRAWADSSPIRAVIAKTNRPEVVDQGGDASQGVNTFSVRTDWVGTLRIWDGDNFEVDFVKE